jgi:hypothetical protein
VARADPAPRAADNFAPTATGPADIVHRTPRIAERGLRSVRSPLYSYEHMFQSSVKRLKALLSLADDLLGDPEPIAAPHPHRRPVSVTIERRGGSVAARPAHCLCPVRPAPRDGGRPYVTR